MTEFESACDSFQCLAHDVIHCDDAIESLSTFVSSTLNSNGQSVSFLFDHATLQDLDQRFLLVQRQRTGVLDNLGEFTHHLDC